MSLTAIHEIVRTGKDGKREVIAPKSSFDPVDKAENDYLLKSGAAVQGKAASAQVHEPKLDDNGSDNADDGLDSLTVAKLKVLAEDEKIDLGDVTRKDDIIAAIRAARTTTSTDDLV